MLNLWNLKYLSELIYSNKPFLSNSKHEAKIIKYTSMYMKNCYNIPLSAIDTTLREHLINKVYAIEVVYFLIMIDFLTAFSCSPHGTCILYLKKVRNEILYFDFYYKVCNKLGSNVR